MKKLLLCRHAEADYSSEKDFDRNLALEGQASCLRMAAFFQNQQIIPDYWLSSSAERAVQTANFIAHSLNPEIILHLESKLYLAEIESWLSVLNLLPSNIDSVIAFGHNPGITDFINYLCGSEIPSIATCTLVEISFELDDWQLISRQTGSLGLIQQA